MALCAAGLEANLIASDSKPSDRAAVNLSQQERAPVVGHDPVIWGMIPRCRPNELQNLCSIVPTATETEENVMSQFSGHWQSVNDLSVKMSSYILLFRS